MDGEEQQRPVERLCPILVRGHNDKILGRCWFYVGGARRCPKHGDVSVELERFQRSGSLTDEKVRARA